MKKFNTLRRSLLVASMLAVTSMAQAQAVKLTLGHGTATDNPRHTASLKFAEVAKAKSNGRIEVTVAPASQLGDDAAMVTALRTGALDMSANSQGAVANAVPEYAAFGMPFLFSSQAQAWKVMDGVAGQELAQKSAEKGLIVLAYWDNGIRHMSNNKRPLLKPEDLKGLKMRTPPDSVTVDIMQSVGAEAQQIKFSELYVALQQGVVDGQENPLVHMYANKMQEVQKFISLTNHVYTPVALVASKKFWDGLSAADKAGVQKAATEAGLLQRKYLEEGDKDVVGKFAKAGVTVTPVPAAELARIQDKVKSVVTKFAPVIGEDFVKQFYAEIEKARSGK